ncbi:MAG: VWA domain-containing protein [Gammaproteobacteria bacterium]|nr:VWA domain-containing protein [Gammaproteobacteria bacterium]
MYSRNASNQQEIEPGQPSSVAPPAYDDSSSSSQKAPPALTYGSTVANLLQNVPTELQADYISGYESKKVGMLNHEARVCLILDVSASMQNPNEFFEHRVKGNQVQRLINKALTLGFLFDDNQTIELFPFGDKVYPPLLIDRNNFMNATQLVLASIGGLKSSTNYASPVEAVRQHYFKQSGVLTQPQKCSDAPVFAIFITDGEPTTAKVEAMNQFKSASHQAIFFKFIALKGKQEDQQFLYLNSIDDADVKEKTEDDGFYIDNCDLVVLNNPDELTMNKLIHEYRPWLVEAYKVKHLLSHNAGITDVSLNSEGRVVSRASSNRNALFNEMKQDHHNANEGIVPPHQNACCIIL